MTLSPSTSAPTAEDTFVFPDAWLKYLHPRRGGSPGKPFTLDTKAPATTDALVAAARTRWLDEALRRPANDKEVVEHLRRMLDGDPTPLGAAALALAAGFECKGRIAAFVDTWILRHGIEFAAVAAVKSGELLVWPEGREQFQRSSHDHRALANFALLQRMRTALAVCSDADHLATVAALAATDANCLSCSATCAYLVPTETDRVMQACREHGRRLAAGQIDLNRRALLQAALSTAEQVGALGKEAQLSHGWRRSPAMDNGIENCIARRIDADRYLVIDLDDGIPVGAVSEDWATEQTLEAVYLSARAELYHAGRNDSGLRFADLDPLTASELLGHLTRLVD